MSVEVINQFFNPVKTPMLPVDSFKNKLAYITGGGTGLGKEMALLLTKLGADVLIVSRKIDILEKTSKEIELITGKQISYFAADVRNADDITKSVDFCESKYSKLPDIIINNAAGNFISPTERLSLNAFKTIIDIVLMGTINVTLTIAKRLIKQKKEAVFLNIVATYVHSGSGYVVPSVCGKSAVAALTKSLAAEWGKFGLRFNAIAPGPIYTEGAFSRLDPTGEFKERVKDVIPAGRMGTTEELANLASYTVSDYSSWLNGEIIFFDGGETAYKGGEFSKLSKVTEEQWDVLETMIRSTNNKQNKSKL